MSLDSLRASLSAVSPQTWFIAYFLLVSVLTGAAYLGLDVTLTDRAITVTLYGWTWFMLPYDQVRSVEVAPMENRFTVLGFTVYDSDEALSDGRPMRKILTNPFVRRVMIRCVDGSVVLLTPDDRDEFIREVDKRKVGYSAATAEDKAALLAADDVITRRIAQERLEQHEHDE